MDMVQNDFKERIKAIMARNKQLDSEIDGSGSRVEKTALKDEKDKNNDELRKIRCQKFQQEQLNEELVFMKKCCQYLQKLGLIKSQYQFCSEFLNKSPHYLAMVICENRSPSPNTIYNLVNNLNQVYDVFVNYDNKQAINRQILNLIDRANAMITKRILECYRSYENGNRLCISGTNE